MITIPLLPTGSETKPLARAEASAAQAKHVRSGEESTSDSGFFRYVRRLMGESSPAERHQTGGAAQSDSGLPGLQALPGSALGQSLNRVGAGENETEQLRRSMGITEQGSALPAGGELFPLLPLPQTDPAITLGGFVDSPVAHWRLQGKNLGPASGFEHTGPVIMPASEIDPLARGEAVGGGPLPLGSMQMLNSPLLAGDSALAAVPHSQQLQRAGLSGIASAADGLQTAMGLDGPANAPNISPRAGTGAGADTVIESAISGLEHDGKSPGPVSGQTQAELDHQALLSAEAEARERGPGSETWGATRGSTTLTNGMAADFTSVSSFAASALNPAKDSLEAAAPADKVQLSMRSLAGDPAWEQELGDRLRMLVDRGRPLAELRLNPPELGSVEVRITNEGERTSVTFVAANGNARDLIESALPKLRDLLADSGLQLANADVSNQDRSGREGLSGEQGSVRRGGEDVEQAVETDAGRTVRDYSLRAGGVDFYV